jgi:hypothetical protein
LQVFLQNGVKVGLNKPNLDSIWFDSGCCIIIVIWRILKTWGDKREIVHQTTHPPAVSMDCAVRATREPTRAAHSCRMLRGTCSWAIFILFMGYDNGGL